MKPRPHDVPAALLIVERATEGISAEALAHWRAARSEVARAAFAPRSRITLSEWADTRRWLSADLGEPGPWRTDRAPYMRAIMDAISDPRVREVTVKKPTRIGATQALVLNTIGYYVDQEPSAIIVALPTIDEAKKFSTQLMQPMFDETPCLLGKLEAVQSKRRRATMLEKAFPGGTLQIIGTKSARAMRQAHGRIILMSEVDAYDFSAGSEGEPTAILPKRAGSYASPKFIKESSPLLDGSSRIQAAYEMGSMEQFHVPCPHCGVFQRLVWGGRDLAYGIKWESGDPETAHYVCEHNGCRIEESAKYDIVARGVSVAQHPERIAHRSFELNAFVSLFEGARWPVLVGEWLTIKGKPERLQVFVNTVMGDVFRETGERPDADVVAKRHEAYPEGVDCPAGVGRLVRTVDVHGDRLELMVCGFGEDEEMWPIQREVIVGDPGLPEEQDGSPWAVLAAELSRTFTHESGAKLMPSITGIDLGGHHTKNVYAFARAHRTARAVALHGSTMGAGVQIVSKQKYSTSGKAPFYTVGVYTLKEAILKRLEKIAEPGPGYIHIPDWMDAEHVAQFVSEELRTSLKGGRPTRAFVKIRDRNETLDLATYAFAMFHALGPAAVHSAGAQARALMAAKVAGETPEHSDGPRQEGESEATPDAPPARPRGGWMQGYRR